MIPPVLHTERLVLRAPVMADFAAYCAFVTSDRARFMGGPHSEDTAWSWFCNDVAQWALLDMGGLILDRPEGGPLGQVSLTHGPQFPEPELGWFLFDGAEGQGYATEAAAALRDWALGPRGLDTIVSYIDPDNAASAAVARRLGATIDPNGATPGNAPTQVWRYRRAA